MKTTATLDKEDVRQAAAGRWPEILTNVGGIESDVLDGKHHKCPRCGGKDRFRFIDKKAGELKIDWDDELVQGTLLTKDGKVVHPNLQPKPQGE